MASFVNINSVASTTDTAALTTSSVSVVKDQLTLMLVGCSDQSAPAAQIAVTNSLASGLAAGMVPVARAVFRTSLDAVYLFVGAALEVNSTSRTYTFTFPTTATGTWWQSLRVLGMKRSGLAVIRQVSAIQENAAAGTPSQAFPQACLTNNAVLGLLGNGTSSPGIGITGFSLLANTGYVTPTTGFESLGVTRGFTGTTPVWTSPSGTEFGAFLVELDTSDYTSQDSPQFEAGIGV